MLKVAICGGSGYTGSELIRLLSAHPRVEIAAVTSERSAGLAVHQHFPHLRNLSHLKFEPLERERLSEKADLFFLALPHGASQETVAFFVKKGKKVIDLSADYRLKDPETYRRWYGIDHAFPGLLKRAVYGLPELYRKKIKKAVLVANPGCYPTSAVLALMPALKAGIVDPDGIVIDSKSGTSGAGRKADAAYSFCEINESFKAYGVGTHRHTPEIEQTLTGITRKEVIVNFTPHLLPVNRGILTTVYCRLKEKVTYDDVIALYKKAYKREPFVRVYDDSTLPDIRNVRGTNLCDIGLRVVDRTDTLIVVSAIDNLVKGAAGQAIQNMNIMMGFEETEALKEISPLP
ncbi:MAG TPA: N-acetyl-gamma-glutamyl-phosphate reductase [Nitrospirae bacterium]|nr:N-acetyl-gamma-glutamyl-phosphate reductase [Nitrospirota bacterium]